MPDRPLSLFPADFFLCSPMTTVSGHQITEDEGNTCLRKQPHPILCLFPPARKLLARSGVSVPILSTQDEPTDVNVRTSTRMDHCDLLNYRRWYHWNRLQPSELSDSHRHRAPKIPTSKTTTHRSFMLSALKD